MSDLRRLEDFLSRCDLSCRTALRVLLTSADDEGRISRNDLLEGVQREYRQLRGAGGTLPRSHNERDEISPFLADSPLEYFEEHTIGRLVDEGLVTLEAQPSDSGDGAHANGQWDAVRLTSRVREARAELRQRGDGGSLFDRLDENLLSSFDRPRAAPAAPPQLERPVADPAANNDDGFAPQQPEQEGDPAASLEAPLEEPPGPVLAPASSDLDGTPPRDDAVVAEPPLATEPAAPAPVVPRPRGSTLGARGLVKAYRKRRVVNEVDVEVTEGEIVGLLGPNGAGKTTTFYMMVGLIAPDKGRVYLGREDLTSVPMYKRARRGIGYLAQEPSIFRKLSVEQNILAILQMRGFARREQRERLERLLDELGIKHLRSTKAYALSGGERRRLEITRALVGEPKFMLLDEPFAGVDPIAVHDIQQIVADLKHRGIGVLISDHNVEQTLDIVDRAYIMYDGRVRVSGTVSELVWNDEVAEIYLGPTLTARMRQRYTHPQ